MKILAIGHSYVVNANRGVMDRLAARSDFQITIASPEYVDGDLRPIKCEPATSDHYKLKQLPAWFTAKLHIMSYRELDQLITPGKFDLVYIWEEPYVWAGFQIARHCKAANIPYVFKTDQNLLKRYPPPFSLFEKYCYRNAIGWIGCGHLVVETRLAKGYPERAATTIPYAVDETIFFPDRDSATEIRQSFGNADPIIGFIGRLNADKGWELLMEVLPKIKSPWNLLVVGSGPLQEKIELWAKAHRISDRVRIELVQHGQMRPYINAMDMLVAPSMTRPNWKEQFGRMLIEAMACRVPVLASDSGEIPFVLSDCGEVVPETDLVRWYDAIERWITSAPNREHFASRGYERCLKTFTAKAVAEQTAGYFQTLLAKPSQ